MPQGLPFKDCGSHGTHLNTILLDYYRVTIHSARFDKREEQ